MSNSKKRKRQLAAAKDRRSVSGETRPHAADGSSRIGTSPASRPRRQDRDRLIAMVLASLAAGFLGVVNADRVTHVSADSLPGNSEHGWPFVYLVRELDDPPMFVIESQVYSWPWPVVGGENRQFNAVNLIGDLVLIVSVAIGTYWGTKLVVQKYDQWRYGGSEGRVANPRA